jgi:hypothetical protein
MKPENLLTNLEVALIAGGCSILGGIIVAGCNYLLTEKSKTRDRRIAEAVAERARHFELYKVIYPEKFKAAIKIMEKAGLLFQDVRIHYLQSKDPQRTAEIASKLDELLWLTKSCEFLLGSDVTLIVSEFRTVCLENLIYTDLADPGPAILDSVWTHEPSFTKLTATLREKAFMDTLGTWMTRELTADPIQK